VNRKSAVYSSSGTMGSSSLYTSFIGRKSKLQGANVREECSQEGGMQSGRRTRIMIRQTQVRLCQSVQCAPAPKRTPSPMQPATVSHPLALRLRLAHLLSDEVILVHVPLLRCLLCCSTLLGSCCSCGNCNGTRFAAIIQCVPGLCDVAAGGRYVDKHLSLGTSTDRVLQQPRELGVAVGDEGLAS
jgi:hypothetical protein